jgi:hypothetical protein
VSLAAAGAAIPMLFLLPLLLHATSHAPLNAVDQAVRKCFARHLRSRFETTLNDEVHHVDDTHFNRVHCIDLHSLLNKVLYEGRNVNRKHAFS